MLWRPRNQSAPWLRAGFSEREGGLSEAYGPGELNLGWTAADAPGRVAENRRRWAKTVWSDGGAEAAPGSLPELVTVGQVHSADSVVVRAGDPARTNPEGRTTLRGDGLMTAQPGVLLGIQTADCVPVLVVDQRQQAVAGFHAGWRGTAARIVEHGIAQMGREFGSRSEDLWAAVGPAIAGCCYSVGEEVREEFFRTFPYGGDLLRRSRERPKWSRHAAGEDVFAQPIRESDGGDGNGAQWFLDLREANRRQLITSGVPGGQIDWAGGCTACSRTPGGRMRYFSHRAEHGRTGRMMALIGVCTAEG